MLKIIRGGHTSWSKYSAYRLLLARNRTALTEVNNVVFGTKTRWRGRSYAVSVPSEAPKPDRRWKRVSKDERRAMVKSFVNKYRVMHDGKFPTVTDARKHVGGSYYFIRSILQELVYKSKMAPSENLLEVGIIEENKVMVDVEAQNDHNTIAAKDGEIGDANDNLEAEKGSLALNVAERTLFEEVAKPTASGGQSETEGGKKVDVGIVPSYFVATESHSPEGETEKVSRPHFDNADEKEEQIISESLLDSGDIKHEDSQYKGSSEHQKNATDDSSTHPDDDAELPKKSSVWGNLKSFADGFFKMWRKL